jgi:hypothetical protein
MYMISGIILDLGRHLFYQLKTGSLTVNEFLFFHKIIIECHVYA